MAGTLFVVATPIGNLEDITARALRVLGEVALIAAEDTRRTAKLLARYGITTRTTSLHEYNERAKGAELVARLSAGDNIALVSDAGTPTISDPGAHLIAEAVEKGIRVEPVPGPSAVMAALSVSAVAATPFTFLGFPPTRSKDRKLWLKALAGAGHTVVFYEAPHRIRQTLDEILASIGDLVVTVGRELTKSHEEIMRGSISVIQTRILPKGEFTVVIDMGQKTHTEPAEAFSPEAMSIEFGRLTENRTMTRRQAISAISRRHGLSAKEVYAALEASKESVG